MDTPLQIIQSDELYICPCGDTFDRKVWHCKKCGNHWPTTKNTCLNCHGQGRIGSFVSKPTSWFQLSDGTKFVASQEFIKKFHLQS